MNYQKIHDDIINRAKLENRKKTNPQDNNYIYYEEHHIIPEHFFINRTRKGPPGWLEGDPEYIDNKVLLTGREHFVIHQLLIKIYNYEPTLIYAAKMMTVSSNSNIGRINNKLYEWLKSEFAKASSIMMTGNIPWNKGTIGICVPWNKGQTNTVQKGVKKSAKAKQNMKKPKSTSHKKAISSAHQNRTPQQKAITADRLRKAYKPEKSSRLGTTQTPEHKLKRVASQKKTKALKKLIKEIRILISNN